MAITNFTEAKKKLSDFIPRDHPSQQSYNLKRMFELMTYLGNPQNSLKIIHVAGTSGKTSTAYYVAALLRETGSKVGLTVSPHVGEINERLQINMTPLPESLYCSKLSEFIGLITDSHVKPTYFELLVAFAYWEFAKQKVDYAVVEVGLGGLLDGTNVVNRADKVCIITDIGLDHTRILGPTLTAIARQKAGIINKQNTIFAFRQSPEVVAEIEKSAEKNDARLFLLNPTDVVSGIEFLPTFQRRNFTLAREAVNYVIGRDRLPAILETQLLHAAHTYIPGRMEIFHLSNKIIIVDGAHNAQKLQALGEAITTQFPDESIAALVSFVAGGEERLDGALQEIAKLTKKLIITTFSGEQDTPKHSIDPAEIIAASKGLSLQTTVIEKPELALAALRAQPEPILLITGSFFLLNHVRPLMLDQ